VQTADGKGRRPTTHRSFLTALAAVLDVPAGWLSGEVERLQVGPGLAVWEGSALPPREELAGFRLGERVHTAICREAGIEPAKATLGWYGEPSAPGQLARHWTYQRIMELLRPSFWRPLLFTSRPGRRYPPGWPLDVPPPGPSGRTAEDTQRALAPEREATEHLARAFELLIGPWVKGEVALDRGLLHALNGAAGEKGYQELPVEARASTATRRGESPDGSKRGRAPASKTGKTKGRA